MWKRDIFLISFVFFFIHLVSTLTMSADIREIIWRDVSGGIRDADLQIVVASPDSNNTVYTSSFGSVFKTVNGEKWNEVLSFRGTGNTIRAIAVSPAHTEHVFAGTEEGLYRSNDGGMHWKKVFSAIGENEGAVLSIAVNPEDSNMIYIGTRAGLYLTRDSGKTWGKGRNLSSHACVNFIVIDHSKSHIIYITTNKGLFKSVNRGLNWNRMYGTHFFGEDNTLSQANTAEINEGNTETEMRSIVLDPSDSKIVYIGTSKGLIISKDGGSTWEAASNLGLGSKNIRHIAMDLKDIEYIYAATDRGVFRYSKITENWNEPYKGLFSKDIRYLSSVSVHLDESVNLWAATKKGIFKTNNIRGDDSGTSKAGPGEVFPRFDHEPTIEEIREAAIVYAEVHPNKIRRWRMAAATRAWLPDVRFAYGKDHGWQSSHYFYKDPELNKYVRDNDITKDNDKAWSISLTWELGDIIWNNDQTSIDSRSRLMVQLRDDVLNEVTRLYYERRRIQIEMFMSPLMEIKDRIEQQLRLQELTANIDSLTGSYLSKRLGKQGTGGIIEGLANKSLKTDLRYMAPAP
jgi:photosystem II stability/assembly factor-like uncharacterized protein